MPGPTFTINTDQGVFSARANKIVEAGRHHLAGVYDGQAVMLYIDGKMVDRQPARGTLCSNATPVTLGKIANGAGFLKGTIEKIELLPVALNDSQMADIIKSGRK